MILLQTVISIASVVIITIISLLTFRRLKKIDNENHIYNLKIELYNKITVRLYDLVKFYDDQAHLYTDLKNADDKEKVAEAVDEAGYDFEDFINQNSLLLPEPVIDKLEKFIDDVIYQEDPAVGTLQGGLKKIHYEINMIVNYFRTDLNIDSVNRSLHLRTR